MTAWIMLRFKQFHQLAKIISNVGSSEGRLGEGMDF